MKEMLSPKRCFIKSTTDFYEHFLQIKLASLFFFLNYVRIFFQSLMDVFTLGGHYYYFSYITIQTTGICGLLEPMLHLPPLPQAKNMGVEAKTYCFPFFSVPPTVHSHRMA